MPRSARFRSAPPHMGTRNLTGGGNVLPFFYDLIYGGLLLLSEAHAGHGRQRLPYQSQTILQ
jgi:hypothetical protein